jgi:hypothetical protein
MWVFQAIAEARSAYGAEVFLAASPAFFGWCRREMEVDWTPERFFTQENL